VTSANAGSLGDLQRAFQDYLLADSEGFAAAVRDTKKADRTILLGVYRDGYALRLTEVLTNDYPGVLAMCGPDDFGHLARAYIAAHPSHHPSARWFGRHFADFAACTPPYDGTPAIAEMARFEWALGEAFDAPDVAPITADALIALAPEAWETLSFKALPTVRLLLFAYNVPQAWQRREEVRRSRGGANVRADGLGGLAAGVDGPFPFTGARRSSDVRGPDRRPSLPRVVRNPGGVCRRRAGGGTCRQPVTRLGRDRNDLIIRH
jgi:Putative DNA-binding domain